MSPDSASFDDVLDDVERHEVRSLSDGFACLLAVGSCVAVGLAGTMALAEVLAIHPCLEVLFRGPAGVDEVSLFAFGRAQQLEILEAQSKTVHPS